MEYGTLDLTVIAQQINREKYLSRRNWIILFGGFILLTLAFFGLSFLPYSGPPENRCEFSCFLHVFEAFSPLALLIGIFIVAYINRRRRNANAGPYAVRLDTLDWPPVKRFYWTTSARISYGWIIAIIILSIAFHFDSDYGLTLFLMAIPYLIFWGVNIWIKSIIEKGNYDQTILVVQRLKRWFHAEPGLWGAEALACSFADRAQESEVMHRMVIAQMLKKQVYTISLWLNNYAVDLLFQDRFDEALFLLETAIMCQPTYASSYDTLASLYLMQNLAPEYALKLAEFGLKLPTGFAILDKSASVAARRATLAWAEARNGLADRARVTLQEALKKANPKHIPYFAELNRIAGETYLTLNDLPAARQHFARAAELDTKGRIGRIAREKLESLPSD